VRASLVLLLVAVFAGGRAAAQQPAAPANLDFESGAPGEVPPGWLQATSQPQPGAAIRVVSEEPRNGAQAALLSRDATAAPTSTVNLLQLVDAASYRGRRVRFRMAAKVDTPTSPAQMWMRIDGPSAPNATPPSLFLDTMDDRPIVAKDWNYYEIVADVPQDAARILFGVYLVGVGRAWVDDASFETVTRVDPPAPEGPKAITRRGLVNLMALARLLGYVRHFHPSDEAAATDWGEFAAAAVKAVESSADNDALTRRLADLFRPIAPSITVVPSGTPRPSARDEAPTTPERQWQHVGFGLSTAQHVYRSERVTVPQPVPEFTAELGGGVAVRIPLTVATDDSGTLPHGTPPPPAAPHLTRGRFSMADRATRLGTLILAWNVLQHSYPYFDIVKTSWSVALSTAMQEAATEKNEHDFPATLRRMIAALHDGQARVIAFGDSDLQFTPPVGLDWIEGRLTVVTADAASGALPGDVVVAIDGMPAAALVDAAEPLISTATPQWAKARVTQEILQGAKDTAVKLRLEPASGGAPSEVTVMRTVTDYPGIRRADAISEVQPGIMYVDLARVTEADFTAALPKLADAKGLVFDVRRPPTYLRPEPFFAHLSEKPVTSPQFLLPVIPAPDREQTSFIHNGEWNIAPAAPFLAAPKVFLTDAHAIGYAESILEMVSRFKLGEIVGSPTAGTDGTVNRFSLPGDFSVLFTASKVVDHDGNPYHGVGIKPTVAVTPTRAGIAAGQDELLDRAVQLLPKAVAPAPPASEPAPAPAASEPAPPAREPAPVDPSRRPGL
jgi:hypothetical protein